MSASDTSHGAAIEPDPALPPAAPPDEQHLEDRPPRRGLTLAIETGAPPLGWTGWVFALAVPAGYRANLLWRRCRRKPIQTTTELAIVPREAA